MYIDLLQLRSERGYKTEPRSERQLTFDALCPAIGARIEPDIAVVTVRDCQILDAGARRKRTSPVKLGLMTCPISHHDGRIKRYRIIRNRRDLFNFVVGPIAECEPAAGTAGGIWIGARVEIVPIERRVVLLPDHTKIGRGPDLPLAGRIGLPASARGLVEPNNLPDRKARRGRHLNRGIARLGVSGQAGCSRKAASPTRRPGENDRVRARSGGIAADLRAVGPLQYGFTWPGTAQRYPIVE